VAQFKWTVAADQWKTIILHVYRYNVCMYVKSQDYGDVSAGEQQGRLTMP